MAELAKSGIKVTLMSSELGETGLVVNARYKPISGPDAHKWIEFTKVYPVGATKQDILKTMRASIERRIALSLSDVPDLSSELGQEFDLEALPAFNTEIAPIA